MATNFNEKPEPLVPAHWMPEVKTIDLMIIKRGLQQFVSRELLNSTIDVADSSSSSHLLSQIAIRLTQKIVAHAADETVVTDTETVPANWWSHLILTITGKSVPRGHGWRWKLYRHAKTRQINTHTTFYRTCPHVLIPDNLNGHMLWLMEVNEDARLGHLQRNRE